MSRTRAQIIEAADDLFYRQGFEHTSFQHIAEAVKISRGNFYHHFKTKNDILDAVIDLRLDRTRDLLDDWEKQSDSPAERIRCFIRILITNWSKIETWGCPVGTLTTELAKLNHPGHDRAARVFALFRDWLREQFAAMGREADADELALEVLTFSQGAATVGNAFHDRAYVSRRVDRMCAWLDEL